MQDRASAQAMKLTSFEALATALEAAGVRYLVAGGLAVGAHGYLRFTKDIDIVIQLIPDNIERTFAALASLGYEPIADPLRLTDHVDPQEGERCQTLNPQPATSTGASRHGTAPGANNYGAGHRCRSLK